MWSPDGNHIAVEVSNEVGLGGDTDVYVVDVNNGSASNLTNHPDVDIGPTWSPDGQKLAFISTRDSDRGEIYVINANGSGLERLTNNDAADTSVSWSPDGQHIAFASDREGNFDIYVMGPDGSGQTRLTSTPDMEAAAPVGHPFLAWSPDSSRIAFVSDRGDNLDVYAVDADGSGETRLTTNANDDLWPTWSPDGGQIAFLSNGNLYSVNGDGSGLTRLTTDIVAMPSWGSSVQPGSTVGPY
jgi:TolB protein